MKNVATVQFRMAKIKEQYQMLARFLSNWNSQHHTLEYKNIKLL